MTEDIIIDNSLSKEEQYQQIIPQIKALIGSETDRTANLANIAAVLKYSFNFFWVGFYIWKKDELVLAPFQGPIACTRIKKGKGVCGTAFEKEETILVPDVDQFPGHIACNSKPKSEIVIPIFSKKEAVGVLDIDNIMIDGFDEVDKKYLEVLVQYIGDKW